jgi:hypothetical protein
MIITKAKPFEEILSSVKDKKNIFIVGCNVCAAKMKTGGEPEVLELADRLEKTGYQVCGWTLPTAACSVRSFEHLAEKNEKIKDADCILVMGCGSGIAVISSVTNTFVTGTNETQSLGGFLGLHPTKNLCIMCGECNVGNFCGICPNARCPKSQMNGPCGGSKGGKCEVSREDSCVWYLIEEKMDSLNLMPTLLDIQEPKNHKV